MNIGQKNKIFDYINNEVIKNSFGKTRHFSHFMYPEQDCVCKKFIPIDFNTNLISNGYLDSFDMMTVLVFVEATFDVKIPVIEATAVNFDSVNKISELIEKHKI